MAKRKKVKFLVKFRFSGHDGCLYFHTYPRGRNFFCPWVGRVKCSVLTMGEESNAMLFSILGPVYMEVGDPR